MARFEPELLTEEMATLLEHAEGVGLPTGAIQREHQEPAQALAQRVLADDFLQLGDGFLMTTELELDVEPLLGERETQLGQPGDDACGEVLVGEVGKGVASPQRICVGEQCCGPVEIIGGDSRASRGGELLVAEHVDRIGRQFEDVPTAAHGDQVGRTQRAPQLRGEPLEAVAHRRRGILTPQGVDDLVGRNHAAGLQRQKREQGAQLRPRDRDVSPVVVLHLESTEQPDPHVVHRTPYPARRFSATSASRQAGGSECAHDTPCPTLLHPVNPMNAIDRAILAVTTAAGGDPVTAQLHIARAQRDSRAAPRRERQVVEIAALTLAGAPGRAAGLALEHALEFPNDAELLARVAGKIPAYDVVVIGGGAAGLSAALVLGRARRRVAVVDAGAPRNAPAAHMQGFLSRDGMPPADFLAAGRAEVAGYGVEVLDDRVLEIDPGFSLHLGGGTVVTARRILLATGVGDELPDIPGVRARWGRDLLHCPYCHGWEVRDQPVGVLGSHPGAVQHAQLVRQWSEDVIFFAHTHDLTSAEQTQLEARGIRVVEGEVARLVVETDRLTGVELADGRVIARTAVFVRPGNLPHPDGLASGLGCALDEAGFVSVDSTGRTSTPGVWAAGNVVDPRAQVITSAGAGSAAAIAINADLVHDDVERAVEGHATVASTARATYRDVDA